MGVFLLFSTSFCIYLLFWLERTFGDTALVWHGWQEYNPKRPTASKSQLWEEDLVSQLLGQHSPYPKVPACFRGKSGCILTTFPPLMAFYPETENLAGSPVCVSRGKGLEGRTPCSEWVLRVTSRWIHSLETDVNTDLETKRGRKGTKNVYLS